MPPRLEACWSVASELEPVTSVPEAFARGHEADLRYPRLEWQLTTCRSVELLGHTQKVGLLSDIGDGKVGMRILNRAAIGQVFRIRSRYGLDHRVERFLWFWLEEEHPWELPCSFHRDAEGIKASKQTAEFRKNDRVDLFWVLERIQEGDVSRHPACCSGIIPLTERRNRRLRLRHTNDKSACFVHLRVASRPPTPDPAKFPQDQQPCHARL